MKKAEDVLRQAFMSRQDYEGLRPDEKIWDRLSRPVLLIGSAVVGAVVLVSGSVMTNTLFAIIGQKYPVCQKKRMTPLPGLARIPHTSRFMLTEEEAAEYVLFVIYLPTALVFSVAMLYLIAGIVVAYTAPKRSIFLKVVENNCCASKRGGVRCLATLNISFLVVFALMALFLGSSMVTLETECSIILFWCYEMFCWAMSLLCGVAAFFLHRKAAVVLDEGEHYGSHTMGMELLEANPIPVTEEVERNVREGFKRWMGSSVLSSSDDDDEQHHPQQGLDDIWDEHV